MGMTWKLQKLLPTHKNGFILRNKKITAVYWIRLISLFLFYGNGFSFNKNCFQGEMGKFLLSQIKEMWIDFITYRLRDDL